MKLFIAIVAYLLINYSSVTLSSENERLRNKLDVDGYVYKKHNEMFFVCIIGGLCFDVDSFEESYVKSKDLLSRYWNESNRQLNVAADANLTLIWRNIQKKVGKSKFSSIKNHLNKISLSKNNSNFLLFYFYNKSLVRLDFDEIKFSNINIGDELLIKEKIIIKKEIEYFNILMDKNNNSSSKKSTELNNLRAKFNVDFVELMAISTLPLTHIDAIKKEKMSNSNSFAYISNDFESLSTNIAGDLLINSKLLNEIKDVELIEIMLVHEAFHFFFRDADATKLWSVLFNNQGSSLFEKITPLVSSAKSNGRGANTSSVEMMVDLHTCFYLLDRYGDAAVKKYIYFLSDKRRVQDEKRLKLLGFINKVISNKDFSYDDYINYYMEILINRDIDHINNSYNLEGNPNYIKLIYSENKRLKLKELNELLSAGSGTDIYKGLLNILEREVFSE